MAEVIKIIDPDNGIGTDYTSLLAWQFAECKDLVTATEQATAKCRCTGGTVDTSATILSDSWTTNATYHIKIWTDPTEDYRHEGTYPSGNKYRIESNGQYGIRTGGSSGPGHVKILGIPIEPEDISWSYGIYSYGAVGWCYIEQCVVKGAFTTGSNFFGIRLANWNNKKYVSNNIIYDMERGALSIGYGIYCADTSSRGQNIYNNTVQNCRTGYYSVSGPAIFKNCVAQDCGSVCFLAGEGFSAQCTHNCSDDNTQPGPSGQNGEVLFEDEPNDDFHLSLSDTVAMDNGIDLSGDALYPITIDIDGEIRSVPWDIGADDVVAVAAEPKTKIFYNFGG